MDFGTQKQKTTTDTAVDLDPQSQAGAGPGPKALGQSGAAALDRMTGVGGLGRDLDESVEHGHLRDAALDIGGGAVGLAEKALPFFKYTVKPYEAQVSSNLYRGSRVDANGMANLKQQGITGIVNLCAENDMDTTTAQQLGMNAKHIPIIDNTAPTVGQVQSFLDFVSGNGAPVYVHCEAGQGRTGTMCAAYRMSVEGWTADRAIAEAKQYGMKMPVQIHFLEQLGATLSGAPDVAGPAAAPAAPGDGDEAR